MAGNERRAMILWAREQLANGLTWKLIERTGRRRFGHGKGRRTLSWWHKLLAGVEHLPDHLLTAEACAPGSRFGTGAPRIIELTTAEVQAVRARVAGNNRTWDSGSIPAALDSAARHGELRPEVVEFIRARQRRGQTPLPASQLRRLRVAPVIVRALRRPRLTRIETVSSDGSLRMTHNQDGSSRLLGAGEQFTIDDATLNVGCVVPGLERRGDPCWERWRVCVGRFQALFVVDQATDYIVGWSYTARPRGSYRSEDLASTLLKTFLDVGLPRELMRERGISAAVNFNRALELSGVVVKAASSPHQKAVESVFNRVHTRLSELPGDVGRYAGDQELAARNYEACKAGGRDPRRHFLELPAFLTAIGDAVREHNARTIHSRDLYGSWVPGETFAKEAPQWLRPFDEGAAWMFAPVVRQLTVRGHAVRTAVDLMDGLKVKFTMGHEALAEFEGRPVTVYFDPLADDVIARVVLDVNVGEWRAGTLLPFRLNQTNWVANNARGRLGYGDGMDIGRHAANRTSRALVRTVKAVRPDGAPTVPTTTVRNEAGEETRFNTTTTATTTTTAEPRPKRGGVVAKVQRELDRWRPATEAERAQSRRGLAELRRRTAEALAEV